MRLLALAPDAAAQPSTSSSALAKMASSSDSPGARVSAASSSDAPSLRIDASYRGSPPSFDPAHTLRRRDAAFLVARLAGLDTTPPPSSTFRDVLPGDLRFGAIEALWRERVAYGCRAAHGVRGYCPDRPATRGQMAVLLGRAFGIAPPDGGQHFSDVPRTHPAYAFVEGLAQLGLAEPCPGRPGTYCPDAAVTRADAAAMLSRFLLAGVTRPRAAEIGSQRPATRRFSRSCPAPRAGTLPRSC
jgi:hypothetical protein